MARVLHVIPAFLPATDWGGPVVSTAAICRAAAAAGHEVQVLTTDSATPETAARLDLPRRTLRLPDGVRVHYARRSFGQSGSWDLLRRLPGEVARADLVHLSMTYSFPTLPTLALCRLYNRPVVWSPRGAIQATGDWSKARRRRLKSAFERVARRLAPSRTVLHVTAEAEARGTARRMPGLAVTVIANAVALPARPDHRRFRPGGRLRLLFLSRLHPKKGLDDLLTALRDLPDHVTLAIAGRGSPAYERSLRRAVQRLDLSDRVTFLGRVEGEDKSRAYAAADAFVLPTQSENFGIVVAEALAAGVPVITTRAAPWAGLVTHRCGHWIDEGPAALRAALHQFDALPAPALEAMGRRGAAWMARDFGVAEVGAQMCALYARLLASGPVEQGAGVRMGEKGAGWSHPA